MRKDHSEAVHAHPFYIPLGQMNPKGLLMFIPPRVYTPYKVDCKPGKPRGMNKGYVLLSFKSWGSVMALACKLEPQA